MNRSRFLTGLSMFTLAFVLAACGGDDNGTGPGTDDGPGGDDSPAASADSLVALALDSLEEAMFAALNINDVAGLDGFSFAAANGLFEEALDASPSHDVAAFGAAVTTIFMLEDDPGVRAIAEDWEDYENGVYSPVLGPLLGTGVLTWDRVTLPVSLSGDEMGRLAHAGLMTPALVSGPALSDTIPPVSDILTALDEIARPALEEALGYLLEIDDAAFVFDVTEAMQGELEAEADVLELDYTEVLALRASIEIALAMIDIASAYVIDPDPVTVEDVAAALDPSSDFLTLTASGATRLSDALASLLSAADALLDAVDALEAETDDQSDDIIKYDPTGLGSGNVNDVFNQGLSSSDLDEVRTTITDVRDALTGPITVNLDDYSWGGTGVSFEVDPRQFFLSPVDDLKTLLPDYDVFTYLYGGVPELEFRWTAVNLADWTIPDPTFGGVLPGMTHQKLVDDLHFSDLFFELDRFDFYWLQELDGGPPPCGFCSILSLDQLDGAPTAYLYINEGATTLNAQGPYTVTDAGDADPLTFTITLDLTDDAMNPVMLTGDYVDFDDSPDPNPTVQVEYDGSTYLFGW